MALWADELALSPAFVRANSVFVARIDDELVGCAGLTLEAGEFELDHLWVEPTRMRAGIGRALATQVLDTARRLGATRVRVVSDPHALAFYERLGARQSGRVASWPVGRTLPVLEFTLSGDELADEAR